MSRMHTKAELRSHLEKAYLAKGLPPKFFERFLLLFKLLKAQSPDIKFHDLLRAASRAELHRCTPEKIADNVSKSARLLGIQKPAFIAAALKQPTLFYQRPEGLKQKVDKSAALLGIPPTTFLRSALVRPNLLYQKPETTYKNIKDLASVVGTSVASFAIVAVKWPALFSQRPETIKSNLERSALVLGISEADFLVVAFKSPMLFSRRPESLKNNIEESARLLGIEETTFTRMSIQRPSLLISKPETSLRKARLLDDFLIAAGSQQTTVQLLNANTIVLTYSEERIRRRTQLARSMTVGSPAAFLSVSDKKLSLRQAKALTQVDRLRVQARLG